MQEGKSIPALDSRVSRSSSTIRKAKGNSICRKRHAWWYGSNKAALYRRFLNERNDTKAHTCKHQGQEYVSGMWLV